MTANERLEALLNRAGQTISDLPTWGGDMRRLGRAKREALTEMGDRWTDSQTISADEMPLLEYILKLTDIIDRMEWALDKTIRERDYLARRPGDADCDCDNCVYSDVNEAEMPCYQCDNPGRHFEFAGIPEDWRADDD